MLYQHQRNILRILVEKELDNIRVKVDICKGKNQDLNNELEELKRILDQIQSL